MIEMPWDGQLAQRAGSAPRPPLSVSTAVGSSSTRMRVFSRAISRAISVNCLWPTGISETRVSGSRVTPSLAMEFGRRAVRMSARSRTLMRSPKASLNTDVIFMDSRFSTMFSVVVNPGNQAELLVGHADAGIQGVERALELHLLAVDADLALVAAGLADHVHPEQDPHEGGLARAVLSHQADDFPGLHIEAHIMQNDRPVESLEMFCRERSGVSCPISSPRHAAPPGVPGSASSREKSGGIRKDPSADHFPLLLLHREVLLRHLQGGGGQELLAVEAAHDVGIHVHQSHVLEAHAVEASV